MPLQFHIRLFIPKFLSIMLIMLGFVPMHLSGAQVFFPLVDIIIVFYWSLYRPQVVPDWFLFLMGILSDILVGGPVGIQALVNIIMKHIVTRKREDSLRDPIIVVWVNFAVFSFIAFFIKWIIFSFAYNDFFAIKVIYMQMIMTIISYPVFHGLFNIILSIVPDNLQDA